MTKRAWNKATITVSAGKLHGGIDIIMRPIANGEKISQVMVKVRVWPSCLQQCII